MRRTGDAETLRSCCRCCVDIVEHHLQGTRFGIGVDPADGLLRQGAEGYQLTWMDAKVDDWVVTPRRGKAVEINALWYNALRLLRGMDRASRASEATRPSRGARGSARASRSTSASGTRQGGYLYDVVDGEHGDDPACRPNQVFAISLDSSGARPRALGAGDGRRASAAADAGRPALARARHPDYKAQILRRPALARRRLSPGNGVGLADRSVRRRVAEAASGRPRGRATLARRLRCRI